MISSLLSNLSAALGRVFLIGIVPLLAFLLLHGLMVYAVFPAASRWIDLYLKPEFTEAGLLTFALFLAIITVAYLLSSLSVLLREAMEGKPLGKVSTFLGSRYAPKLDQALKEREEARIQLQKLASAAPAWSSKLRTARIAVKHLAQCSYARDRDLQALLDIRKQGGEVTEAELDREYVRMFGVLQSSSPDWVGDPRSKALDGDLRLLRQLVEYSRERWSTKLASALERLEFDFGGQKLVATRMGNIAQSVSYYAETRYGIRLDVFWSRLQEAVAKNDKFNEQLQEANTRLDFVVSLFWHTLLFTLIWVMVLPLLGHSQPLFMTIAVGGAAACALWYHIAVQNCRALASLMRAAIDLHRHAVLESLSLPAPRSLVHERALWDSLEQHVAYGSRSDLIFKVDKQ